jgi:tetratricopeptide (TPR) repeat protein
MDENYRCKLLVEAKVCLGDTLFEAEKTSESIKFYEDALALRRTIPEWGLDPSELLQKLAWGHHSQEDWDAALEAFHQALCEIDFALEHNPNYLWAPVSRVYCQIGIAGLLARKNKFPEAFEILRKCLTEVDQHAGEEPEDAYKNGWSIDMSMVRRNMGIALRRHGDLTMALKYHNDACKLMERLVEKAPSNSAYLGALGDCYEEIAEVLCDQADPDAALDSMKKSIELIRKLVSLDPTNASRQYQLASRLERLGDIQRVRDDNSAALACYQESLEIAGKQPESVQATPGWQRRAISSRASIARIESD